MASNMATVVVNFNDGKHETWMSMSTADVEKNQIALDAAKKELDALVLEPIAPGTRVRVRNNISGDAQWLYGTVASPESPVFGTHNTVGVMQEPQHLWAYWDGDTSAWASYVMRNRVEVVS